MFLGFSFLSGFSEYDGCVLPVLLACLAAFFTGNTSSYWRLGYSVELGEGCQGIWSAKSPGDMAIKEGRPQLEIYYNNRDETEVLSLGAHRKWRKSEGSPQIFLPCVT